MSKALATNKYFVVTFVISIILGGMTFGNLPGPEPSAPVQTINGETFRFANSQVIRHDQRADCSETRRVTHN